MSAAVNRGLALFVMVVESGSTVGCNGVPMMAVSGMLVGCNDVPMVVASGSTVGYNAVPMLMRGGVATLQLVLICKAAVVGAGEETPCHTGLLENGISGGVWL